MCLKHHFFTIRSVFAVLLLVSSFRSIDSIFAEESASLAPINYNVFLDGSTVTTPVNHWGKNAKEQFLQDYPLPYEYENYAQFESIHDMAITSSLVGTEMFFIARGSNNVGHRITQSLSDFPAQDDTLGVFHGGGVYYHPNVYFMWPSGLDAQPIQDGTRLLVCDWGQDAVYIYDRYPDAIVLRQFFRDDEGAYRLRNPRDAEFIDNGNNYIAVISHDGDALLVYDTTSTYTIFEPYPGFRSSIGLPTSINSLDGKVGFLKNASHLYYQDGLLYLTDTGHGRVLGFNVDQGGLLSLSTVNELGSDSRPVGISGDQSGRIFVTDSTRDVVIAYSAFMSGQNHKLREIERFGNGSESTMQLTEPRALAAYENDMFISEKIDDEKGLVHGVMGGSISNLSFYVDPSNSQNVIVDGVVSGTCTNIALHVQLSSDPEDAVSYNVGSRTTGPLQSVSGQSPLVVSESRPFNLYDVFVTWNSATCGSECTAPTQPVSLTCGTYQPDLEAAILSTCQNTHGLPLEVCWVRDQSVQRYQIRWREAVYPPLWSTAAFYSSGPYELSTAAPGTVYEIEVIGLSHGAITPSSRLYFGFKVSIAPPTPSITNRTSTIVSCASQLPEHANGFVARFGTTIGQPDNVKYFPPGCPIELSYPLDIQRHDQKYYLSISGALFSPDDEMVEETEGPLSDQVAFVLAPTTSGTVNWPERWFAEYDPVVNLSSDVTVAQGASLTIDPGVAVLTSSNSTLHINGTLNADGNTQDEVVLANPGQPSGVVLSSGPLADITLNNVVVAGGHFGYLCRGGDVTIDNCTFDQNHFGLVMVDAEPTISKSTFENSSIGYGAVIIRSDPTITECDFTGNARSGLLVWNTDFSSIHDSRFENNGFVNPTVWNNGIRMLNGHVYMTCCEVRGNAGPGIAVLQGYLDNDWSDLQGWGHQGARNVYEENVTDSVNLGTNLGQIWLEGAAAFNADYGLNTFGGSTFIGSNAEYGYYEPEDPNDPVHIRLFYDFYLRGNYWGTQDLNVINAGIPSVSVIEPVQANAYTCASPDPTFPDKDPAWQLLNQGMIEEFAGNIEPAILSYKEIIDDYPTSKQAPIAIQRLSVCYSIYGDTWPEIRSHFIALADTVNPVIKMFCLNTAAWCLVEMGDLQAAQAEFQSLIDQSFKDYEVLYNGMGKLMSQLEEEDWGSLGVRSGKGDLQKENSASKSSVVRKSVSTLSKKRNEEISSLQIHKYAATLTRTIDGIDSVLGIAHTGPSDPTLPTDFALYQNYPNPFNPTTEIRFDLPEAVRAELKVFNILGQEVVTLVDDVRNAGAYRILWDGKNAAGLSVASGVYIYQLKTPNFTNAKKMMLLR